jgi:hypothetical protein
MKTKTLVTIIIVFVAIAIIAIVASWNWTIGKGGKIEDFAKVATLWLTCLTALLAAVVSIISSVIQAKNQQALEKTKSLLATNLEFIKSRLSVEREAYQKLFAAAIVYYYSLSPLEVGKIDEALIEKAEEQMINACNYLMFIEEEHKELWFGIWQEARNIADLAKNSDISKKKEVWRNNVKGFGRKVNEFESIAATKYKEITREISTDVDQSKLISNQPPANLALTSGQTSS